ncbi:hypothetical protein FTUN_7062 [Frigoriglobus tundricola]|uniref:Uncharacterized protein n=1 Tax=Frigoriglobus tundricola TaxID=2774151 RepID=A0A6M5Z1D1_9BACT|nr:hypothetical protein FTUN_7062 [Frigoriglobus tundricola]
MLDILFEGLLTPAEREMRVSRERPGAADSSGVPQNTCGTE